MSKTLRSIHMTLQSCCLSSALLLLLLLLLPLSLHAQSEEPSIDFTDIALRQEGSTSRLSVTFRLHVRGRIAGYDEAIHLVPTYEIDGHSYRFPSVLINDPVRERFYRREVALSEPERPAHVIVTQGHKTDETITYHEIITLPEGVSPTEGRVVLRHYLQDCCHLTEMERKDLGAVIPADPSRRIGFSAGEVPFLRPQREEEKRRQESLRIRIHFLCDKSDILTDYSSNASELRRVDRAMQPLLSRPDEVTLLSTDIRGYASPEAPEEYNLRLSHRRAVSLRSYLEAHYGADHLGIVSAVGMGENWSDLSDTLQLLTLLPHREEILALLTRVADPDRREEQIRMLDGGKVYRHLLDSIYPALRCNVMEMTYRVRPYTTEEADRLLDIRPQELSVEEIFLVAQRRNEGRTEGKDYGREYDLAAAYFATDPIALLNASSAALVRGEYDLAGSYLMRVGEKDPRAYNNLGLYYWSKGDEKRAHHFLELAQRVPETAHIAEKNLRRLEEMMREK